jgi:hypothetical protein
MRWVPFAGRRFGREPGFLFIGDLGTGSSPGIAGSGLKSTSETFFQNWPECRGIRKKTGGLSH